MDDTPEVRELKRIIADKNKELAAKDKELAAKDKELADKNKELSLLRYARSLNSSCKQQFLGFGSRTMF